MYCRKIELDEIVNVCHIYLEEENIVPNRSDLQKYIEHSKKIYERMMQFGSYTYGCFTDTVDKTKSKLIGVINVNKNLDFYPGYHLSPYVHLETFIVAKAYRNSGVGTFLMKDVMNQIKKEGYSYVIIQSGNLAVKKIAENTGLKESLFDMRNDQITSYHINLDD